MIFIKSWKRSCRIMSSWTSCCPDEDGLEIVAKLRRRPETKKLPVIMVTAKSTEIDKVKGLDVGAG